MSDNLDFLDGEPAAPQPVTPEPKAEVTQEAAEGQPRGPDGKFAPKSEAAPEPQPEAPQPAPVQAQPERPEPGHVPITALLDEREKRKQLEAELASFRNQHMQASPQIDPMENPAAFTQQVVLNARLDLSEEIARGKHGDEVVNAARDWALQQFRNRPAFQQEVLSQRNPYEYVVQQFNRDKIASEVSLSELEQFKAWKAAQAQLQAQQQAAPAAPPTTSIPTPSLAAAPSAGGDKPGAMPMHEGAAFDAIFR